MASNVAKGIITASTRRSAVNSVASSSRLFSSTSTSSNTALEHASRTSSPSSSSDSSSSSSDSQVFKYREYKDVVFPNPPPHPRPYGIHVATLYLSAHHPYNLDLYTKFAYNSAHSLGIPASRPASLPKSKELITVIKAPFAHKKFQENFERRHHRRAIEVYDTDRETLDLWLRYVKKNGIGGVGMRARVHEFVDVGFGAKELDDFENPKKGSDSQAQIEAAAAKLIAELSAEDEVSAALQTDSQEVQAEDIKAEEEGVMTQAEEQIDQLQEVQPIIEAKLEEEEAALQEGRIEDIEAEQVEAAVEPEQEVVGPHAAEEAVIATPIADEEPPKKPVKIASTTKKPVTKATSDTSAELSADAPPKVRKTRAKKVAAESDDSTAFIKPKIRKTSSKTKTAASEDTSPEIVAKEAEPAKSE